MKNEAEGQSTDRLPRGRTPYLCMSCSIARRTTAADFQSHLSHSALPSSSIFWSSKVKTMRKMKSSDNLRSELCTTFISGMDSVKSYGSPKFAKRVSCYVFQDFQYTPVILYYKFSSLPVLYNAVNGKLPGTLCCVGQPHCWLWRAITFQLIHPREKSGT